MQEVPEPRAKEMATVGTQVSLEEKQNTQKEKKKQIKEKMKD